MVLSPSSLKQLLSRASLPAAHLPRLPHFPRPTLHSHSRPPSHAGPDRVLGDPPAALHGALSLQSRVARPLRRRHQLALLHRFLPVPPFAGRGQCVRAREQPPGGPAEAQVGKAKLVRQKSEPLGFRASTACRLFGPNRNPLVSDSACAVASSLCRSLATRSGLLSCSAARLVSQLNAVQVRGTVTHRTLGGPALRERLTVASPVEEPTNEPQWPPVRREQGGRSSSDAYVSCYRLTRKVRGRPGNGSRQTSGSSC